MNTKGKNIESSVESGTKDPESASEISLDLVKKVLQREPSISKFVSLEIDKDFGNWSLLGDIVRVKLNYSESECEPESVIVKFQKDPRLMKLTRNF